MEKINSVKKIKIIRICVVAFAAMGILINTLKITLYPLQSHPSIIEGGVSAMKSMLFEITFPTLVEIFFYISGYILLLISFKVQNCDKKTMIIHGAIGGLIVMFLLANSIFSYPSPTKISKDYSKPVALAEDISLLFKGNSDNSQEVNVEEIKVKAINNVVDFRVNNDSSKFALKFYGVDVNGKDYLLSKEDHSYLLDIVKAEDRNMAYTYTFTCNTEFPVVTGVKQNIEGVKEQLEHSEFYENPDFKAFCDMSWYIVTESQLSISNANQLAGFAYLVNKGYDFAGQTVKLEADLDLAGTPWLPIGNSLFYNLDGSSHREDNPFKGTFDGDNHFISNMNITSDLAGTGMFGYVGEGAVIKNVYLVNCDIKGNYYVGGFVGSGMKFTLENCHISGNVTAKHIVGGLCGSANQGNIIDCTSSATVTGSYERDDLIGRIS